MDSDTGELIVAYRNSWGIGDSAKQHGEKYAKLVSETFQLHLSQAEC